MAVIFSEVPADFGSVFGELIYVVEGGGAGQGGPGEVDLGGGGRAGGGAAPRPPAAGRPGPAVRGDLATQQRHLDLLGGDENLQEIYKLISKEIWETSRKI